MYLSQMHPPAWDLHPGFTSWAELTILSWRPLAGRLAPACYPVLWSLSLCSFLPHVSSWRIFLLLLPLWGGLWDLNSLTRVEPPQPGLEARNLNPWTTREVPLADLYPSYSDFCFLFFFWS